MKKLIISLLAISLIACGGDDSSPENGQEIYHITHGAITKCYTTREITPTYDEDGRLFAVYHCPGDIDYDNFDAMDANYKWCKYPDVVIVEFRHEQKDYTGTVSYCKCDPDATMGPQVCGRVN